MPKIIVIQFMTLDGVVEDPDGRGGSVVGGWAFRFGPESIGGDRFRLGSILTTGALLFGRVTWEHFSHLWPSRSDPVSTAMNALPKFVRTRGTPDLSVWARSEALVGDLADSVSRLASERDLVVIGSIGLVRDLASAGLVDEYRLLTVPTFVGAGQPLFATVTDLDLVSVQTDGPLLLSTYRPAG